MTSLRAGTGYDIHRVDPTRPLILGGVAIPGAPGLSGHSDADAVLHAVIDALLGAAGLGDIGGRFPPGDERYRDADSSLLLRTVVAELAAAGWAAVNIDITVVCERPRIRPHAVKMQQAIARLLGLDPAAVNVKGKTNEGLDAVGRGEAIAVHAVALVAARVS